MSDIGIHDYGRLAAEYDQRRFSGDVNALKERIRTEAVRDLLPAYSERSLDVACGTGRGLHLIRDRSRTVVGVDATLEMLQMAADKPDLHGARLCRGNAAVLPFPDAAFDTVTCLNFVHLFPEPEAKRAFVTEIGRVLRPGGIAIVEFDNAMQGLLLGAWRKYFGDDIGYDWPWTMRASFSPDMFVITAVRGTSLPFVWRVPALRDNRAGKLPGIKYLTNRLFVRAERL